MIEKIPFLHRQRMYNIIIEEDIAFTALHCILDELIGQGAFMVEEGTGELYRITHDEVCYTIGVDGMDVIISMK